MNQSRRWFGKAVASCAALVALTGGSLNAATVEDQRPNIVLILADDMGYSDLGCYGGEIETPNLDALADRGLRFTQFYNTARCWPTRASLLTGLYNDQTGIHDRSHQLNRRCVTIAEVLRSAGYGTYMVGKWHLMKDWNDPTTDRWPLQRGFERFYGTPVAGNFFNPFNPVRDRTRIKIEDKDYYVTDALTDNAMGAFRLSSITRPGFVRSLASDVGF